MPTDTYGYTGSEQTFVVPQNVQEVIVRLWGAGDGSGNTAGGFVEGTLPVTPGETLPLYVAGQGGRPGGGWPNGGDGGQASETSQDESETVTATAYGGGGQTDIRQGGNTPSDVVGAAGGAGARGDYDISDDVGAAYDGGAGGGTAADGSGSDGGIGGGAPGTQGGTGDTDTSNVTAVAAAAAGGGGGGGSNGGTGGGAFAEWSSTANTQGYGGGGGDGDTGALTNTTVTVGGGNTTDGKIEIEYTAPAGDIVDITQPAAGDLTIDWDRNDDISEGSWEIYRSADGSLGTQIATINDLTVTSYTDTGLGSTEQQFWYTVRRTTPDGKFADDQATGAVNLAAATNLTTSVSADDITVGWEDNSGVEDGYRVFWRRASNTAWNNQSSDRAAGSTSYTAAGLLDGEEYEFVVETFVGLTETRSAVSTPTTTELPDAQAPTLGNGVEDEISVSWTDVTDYGNYDTQYRETGSSTWLAGPTEGVSTTSTTIQGLEDGEEYEVRLRTQTEHVTGAWTTPVSIVTQFPGAQSLSATAASPTSVGLSWSDVSDNEDGFKVERSRETDTGWTAWQTLADRAANTTTYTDEVASSRTTYRYRIHAYTEDATAHSNTDTATTPASAQPGGPVPSQGWHVVITHPQTGRRLIPDILDEPGILPSLNSLPEIRLPVRRTDKWLDPALEDTPEMEVYLDGEKQPIDELRDVEDDYERHVILVGRGGVELENRVTKEYTSARRHIAAKSLIPAETSYSEDVDAPAANELADQDQQSPSTTAELDDLINPADTDPIDINNGDVNLLQTCFTREAENADTHSAADTTGDQFSSGQALLFDAAGESAQYNFSIGYDIPDGRVGIQLLIDSGGSQSSEITVSIDSTTVASTSFIANGLTWFSVDTSALNGLTAGTFTLTIEQTGSGGTGLFVDAIAAPYDTRYSYTWDETVHQAGGYLDGPELYPPAYEVVGAASRTPFAYIGADATITIDDTSNNQRLQVSNDNGENWYPQDGTENNTGSITVDPFPSTGASLRLRATLSRYSPSGAQNQTPRFGYDSQTLSAWDLDADLRTEALLIDEKYDDALWKVLNDISGTGKTMFLWSYNLDSNGNPQVSWTQPGQRVAGRDPGIGSATIEKHLRTFGKVTINGSNRPVSSVSFPAESSAYDLPDSNIVTGSETVYDGNGTNYERGTDYSMDYSAGTVTALSAGGLTMGANYQIDYQVDVSGSYTADGAGSNPAEFVDDVTGVLTDRNAEQIAYVLLNEYQTPRYAGDLTIPRGDVTFDPLEALTLENLDLPADATPLDVRGNPEVSPSGITLRLGSRGTIQSALSPIGETLGKLSKRS